jgi:hypothetical protein
MVSLTSKELAKTLISERYYMKLMIVPACNSPIAFQPWLGRPVSDNWGYVNCSRNKRWKKKVVNSREHKTNHIH